LRFDLSAIALSNLPLLLLAMAPASLLAVRGYRGALRGGFVVVNGFFLWVMIADLEYFEYTGTRATFDLLLLGSDGLAQLHQLLVHHPGLTLLACAVPMILLRSFRLGDRERGGWGGSGGSRGRAVAVRVLALACVVLAVRGGLQRKVLKPLHAFEAGHPELGVLTLNSAFTLLQSPLVSEVGRLEYFADDAEAEALLAAPSGLSQPDRAGGGSSPWSAGRPNVVVILLESFATEFWGAANGGAGYTPFLDSLAAHGILLTHNYANGRRSIDALPSILLGIPSLASTSIAQSGFQGNEWRGLGHFLGEAGYHTSFFHGAPKGTMYFDAIASMAGIAEFHPLERYPGEPAAEELDGNWGMFDEPWLRYAVDEIGRQPTPFFSALFTISTHQPHTLPEAWEDRIPADPEPMHRSLRYTDAALRTFFEEAQRHPWYPNTLFLLTGDHTQRSGESARDTFLGRFQVPLLLFHPGGALPAVDTARVTQHADLFHTVLDAAGVEPGRVPRFGRSIFSSVEGEAVLQSNGIYWLVRRDGVLQLDPTGEVQRFEYRGYETETTPVSDPDPGAEPLARRLRAHLQHFNNSLLRNSFYDTRTP